MEKTVSCKWYQHRDYDGTYVVDLHIINHKTGVELWKTYAGRDEKKVRSATKAMETKVYNRAARIYCD